MPENKRISLDIRESSEQPRAVLVRFAPEIVARIEADAAAKDISPTEIVREIVCEHYGGGGRQSEPIRELHDLIEDRFRHIVYEISRTRTSLYHMMEQSESIDLDGDRLSEIEQWSREDAQQYVVELDAEIQRRLGPLPVHSKERGE